MKVIQQLSENRELRGIYGWLMVEICNIHSISFAQQIIFETIYLKLHLECGIIERFVRI